ncbi:hypothetical protein GGD81_004638 [Rhodobium orientis]|uniref:Uncharacterized protein n=1 Tax=Rhodobium orientis TaxID=34017 RepID=A0A327JFL3_9HYPH|nr:hypothetical protein [Rhodobium orientis]MBB4305557.1 hypothetical protein [Rhodobium orientis]MBK5948735.1 hypothetical protein [Rhodobium orientis]RAI25109.1 hypothetical protein CH339_19750 [Rhodobium orientis]
MSLLRLLGAAALAAALSAASAASAPKPLPDACAVLKTLDAAEYLSGEVRYDLMAARRDDAVAFSQCVAVEKEGAASVSLQIRELRSGASPAPAATQREDYVKELAETFGFVPEAEDVAVGEAAVWIGDVGQLTVWYRDGRVQMIVSGRGGNSKDLAAEIARRVVEKYP